jgi:uncharacterized membrane-anchored protein
MSQWSAPWNAPKKQVEALIEPVKEIIAEPAPVVETPAPEPIVEETPVVEEAATKKTTKKVEPTPAE